jgi:hypothetical protein
MDYDREQGVKVRVTQEYMIPESTAFTHLRVEGSQWMSMECDISLVRLNVTVESRRADGSVDHAVELRVEDPSHDHIIVLEPAFQQSLMVTAENIPDTCQMLSYSFMVMGVNL